MVVRWSEKQERSEQESISGVIGDETRRQSEEEIHHFISSLLFPIFPQYFILQVSKLLPTSID